MAVIVGDRGSLYVYSADSLAEFVRRVGYIKTDKRLYFRGLSNFRYDLSPSINRQIKSDSAETWISRELRLVEFAEQSIPELFTNSLPAFLISNMQHYGIPTRMLDVTENAIVALYFACLNSENDGKVVVFEGIPVSAFNPYVNIIADTYRLTRNEAISFDEYRYLVYKQPYTSTIVYPNWEDRKGSVKDTKLIESLRSPIIVDVGMLNQRQRNQNGKFIIFPNIIDNTGIKNEMIRITETDEIVKAVITIPKESKEKILNQLEYLGITESFIFPDDISKVFGGITHRLSIESL